MGYYRQGPGRSGGGAGVRFGVPPLTPAVKALLIANGGVWLLQMVLGRAMSFPIEVILGLVPDRVVHGWLWQPFTYMFLHSPSGISHILLNMLILWMIGGELERHWRSRAFLRYYVVCGVGAGILVVLLALWFGGMTTVTIGASGAIYGLILAYGMLFGERTILFWMIFPMKARTFAILLFVIAFVSSFDVHGTVSHIAHIGGMVVGYLYLKRAWRVGEFYRELKWKLARRKFKVVTKDDDTDRWVH